MTTPPLTFRVLVVDDNERDLMLLEEAVREASAPIKLVTFIKAAESLDFLSHDQQFRLILSDLNMPDVHGLELFQK